MTGDAKTRDSIKIPLYLTWTQPVTLPEVSVVSVSPEAVGHTTFVQQRLTDLKTLEDIAHELECEGAHGLSTGKVKVGVEGGGMDEEAVRCMG